MIIAIIITYNPNYEILVKSISSLYRQVDKIIMIKNSGEQLELCFENVEIIQLNSNEGIAYAQNVGIKKAIAYKAEYVLFSDQDTIYPENYIKNFEPYLKENESILFAPLFYNEIKKTYSEIMIKKFKSARKVKGDLIYIQHAISSGSIVRTSSFGKVGLMNEELFIDYVDFEWCWRASWKGFKMVCVPNIVINHQLGDATKKVFSKQVTLRSDVRYYYMIRNGFYLSLFCEYLTNSQKIRLFLRSMKFVFGVILLEPTKSRLVLCKKAMKDGFHKQLGKM